MNGTDNKILRGEVMVVLRLMIAQLRRVRYIEQLTAPVKLTDTLGPSSAADSVSTKVLLFSFMGPQQARLVEAYFNDLARSASDALI